MPLASATVGVGASAVPSKLGTGASRSAARPGPSSSNLGATDSAGGEDIDGKGANIEGNAGAEGGLPEAVGDVAGVLLGPAGEATGKLPPATSCKSSNIFTMTSALRIAAAKAARVSCGPSLNKRRPPQGTARIVDQSCAASSLGTCASLASARFHSSKLSSSMLSLPVRMFQNFDGAPPSRSCSLDRRAATVWHGIASSRAVANISKSTSGASPENLGSQRMCFHSTRCPKINSQDVLLEKSEMLIEWIQSSQLRASAFEERNCLKAAW
mmetsp:Transcript_16898/g.59009  ORF Transcript_16898/g.59009 Transcript_16898/m.59009 type:complete len:270 (+) Transcript_16898:2334-3143(+)